MCRIFAGIPHENYESETRSIRLGGHATSIRLEATFWTLLEGLAAGQGMPLARFLTTLHDEVLELHGEVRNFASLLRCVCLLHIERLLLAEGTERGLLPGDLLSRQFHVEPPSRRTAAARRVAGAVA